MNGKSSVVPRPPSRYSQRRRLIERLDWRGADSRSGSSRGAASDALRACAVLAACANVALSIALIGRASLWGDEGFVAQMVRLSWRQMLHDLGSIDFNMSAYYILVKAWTSLVGVSEVSLRFPSLSFAILTMIAVGRLGSRLYGERAGSIALILLVTNPFALLLSITARPYALLACVTVVATLQLTRAVGGGLRQDWLLVALLDVLAIHVHMLAFLVVMAHGVFVLTSVRPLSRVHATAAAFVTLGALPTFFFAASREITLGWIPPVTVQRVVAQSVTAVGSGGLLLLLTVAVVAALVRGRSHDHHSAGNSLHRLLPLCVLVPVALILVLLPYQSLLVPSYLYVVVPFALVLAAAAIADLPVPVAIAGLALISALGAYHVARDDVPSPSVQAIQDWRGADRVLDAAVRDGDAAVYPNVFYRVVGEYYGSNGARGWQAKATALLPSRSWGEVSPYHLDRLNRPGLMASRPLVRRETVGYRRIWLIGPSGGRGASDDPAMQADARTLDAAGFRRTESFELRGVDIWLYSRAS